MHIKGKNSWIKHLDFIGLNFLAFVFSFIAAYGLRFGDFGFVYNPAWKSVMAVMCLLDLIVVFITNPFSGIFRRPYYEDVVKIFLVAAYTFIIVVIFFYLLKVGAVYSRLVFGITFLLYFITASALVLIRKKLLLSGKSKSFSLRMRKILVIAEFGNIEDTVESIYASDIKEYEIVGFCFPQGGYDGDTYKDLCVIDSADLADYIVNNHIDDVFVGVAPDTISAPDYRALVENGVTVHISIESMIGTQTDDQFITTIGINRAVSVGPYAFDGKRMIYLAIKRGIDIVFSLIGCIFLLPIIIIVKISNLLSGDHAPIFYYQMRVGQYGKVFKLAKFRSMVPNADEILQEMLKEEHYRKEWEENQKFENDPRITKIGRILRKTSLDEFPQFINILKGEMSLVGPRPLIVGELEEHDGLTLYNKVKPGITGWWGCNGRSNINYKERLELEYYYVKNCSLYLDVLCILRTAYAVIKKDGAQ